MLPADVAGGAAGFAGSIIICGDAVASCWRVLTEDGSNIRAAQALFAAGAAIPMILLGRCRASDGCGATTPNFPRQVEHRQQLALVGTWLAQSFPAHVPKPAA